MRRIEGDKNWMQFTKEKTCFRETSLKYFSKFRMMIDKKTKPTNLNVSLLNSVSKLHSCFSPLTGNTTSKLLVPSELNDQLITTQL